MGIVEIAVIAARYDTLIAQRTTQACVRAAIALGPEAVSRLQRAFEKRAGEGA